MRAHTAEQVAEVLAAWDQQAPLHDELGWTLTEYERYASAAASASDEDPYAVLAHFGRTEKGGAKEPMPEVRDLMADLKKSLDDVREANSQAAIVGAVDALEVEDNGDGTSTITVLDGEELGFPPQTAEVLSAPPAWLEDTEAGRIHDRAAEHAGVELKRWYAALMVKGWRVKSGPGDTFLRTRSGAAEEFPTYMAAADKARELNRAEAHTKLRAKTTTKEA